MNQKDLISVIVPVYNVEKYIERCIKSILRQTYRNIEIILIDDGSTDSSGKICDKYKKKDSRIKVLKKKNGGLSTARNAGIKIATGKYITFVDSDDFIEKDYVEYLYYLIKKYNVNLSFCKFNVCYQGKNKNLKSIDNNTFVCDKISAYKEILYAKNFEVSACAKMFLKKHFEDVKFPNGKLFEDNGTIYKLIDKNDFIGVGFEKKYNYMIRKNSITKENFSEKQFDLIEMSDNMCNFLSKYNELESALNRKRCVARLSVYNRMINSSERNKENEKRLRKEILKYRMVIFDKEASLRDKIALFLLMCSSFIYKFSWNLYEKITGRR